MSNISTFKISREDLVIKMRVWIRQGMTEGDLSPSELVKIALEDVESLGYGQEETTEIIDEATACFWWR